MYTVYDGALHFQDLFVYLPYRPIKFEKGNKNLKSSTFHRF